MFRELSVEDFAALRLANKVTVVDVRSPSEYAEATIPGSLNIPLFDDAERAEIGTLYKQKSIAAANERGIEIVSAKLPAFIKAFADITGPKVVFCWRGGMRSKTAATLLDLVGMRMQRLTGGYRAYRQWVVAQLDERPITPNVFVLHGHTGTGKTEILRRLAAKNYPVINLEAMADHRGSVFGEIGLKGHNQKTFDGLLLDGLIRVSNEPLMLMEAESKRIGKVVMPERLVRAKEAGHQIWIELPIEVRVANIMADYKPAQFADKCMEAFQRIKMRIHTPIANEIEQSLKSGQFERAIELLLVHYYDERYDFTSMSYGSNERNHIQATSIEDAVAQIEQVLK
jgi:tRNA 2-selenouridine synthase